MEISGLVFLQVPFFSGAGIDTQSSKSSFSGVSLDAGNPFSASAELRLLGSRDSKVAGRSRQFPRFRNESHLQYYYESPRCGSKKDKDKVTTKKKLKLLKSLSKDLSMFSDVGFGVDSDQGLIGEVKGKMISEAAEVLLKQLQQLRAEEKELKKKRKEENAQLKAARMKTMLACESSSSESSDSECGNVIDMTNLRIQPARQEQEQEPEPEPEPVVEEAIGLEDPSLQNLVGESCRAMTGDCGSAPGFACDKSEKMIAPVTVAARKRIEVCMGGKCRKSGGEALLEEFSRVVGIEGAVVGCKCMGKCREGPNARVMNSTDGIEEDDSVRTPTNPLCIGVGLQDVGVIVSNFFGDTPKEVGLSAAV